MIRRILAVSPFAVMLFAVACSAQPEEVTRADEQPIVNGQFYPWESGARNDTDFHALVNARCLGIALTDEWVLTSTECAFGAVSAPIPDTSNIVVRDVRGHAASPTRIVRHPSAAVVLLRLGPGFSFKGGDREFGYGSPITVRTPLKCVSFGIGGMHIAGFETTSVSADGVHVSLTRLWPGGAEVEPSDSGMYCRTPDDAAGAVLESCSAPGICTFISGDAFREWALTTVSCDWRACGTVPNIDSRKGLVQCGACAGTATCKENICVPRSCCTGGCPRQPIKTYCDEETCQCVVPW